MPVSHPSQRPVGRGGNCPVLEIAAEEEPDVERARLTEEDATDYGIAGKRRKPQNDVATQIPDQVLAATETGCRPGIQDVITRIENIHFLDSSPAVPIEQIDGYLVGVLILEGQVDGEGASGVPASGDTIARHGSFLKCAHVAAGRAPGIGVVSNRGDGDVRRVRGGIVNDGIAIGAIGILPRPLSGGIGLDKSRGVSARWG